MITSGLVATPINVWNWGIANKNGACKQLLIKIFSDLIYYRNEKHVLQGRVLNVKAYFMVLKRQLMSNGT